MRRQIKKSGRWQFSTFLTLLSLSVCLSGYPYQQLFASGWRNLTPGIAYRDLTSSPLAPWAHIHAFRIDLKQHNLDLMSAKSIGLRKASIDTLAQNSQALIAINGGFFDTFYRPLGLRVQQHKAYNPIKRISWWGIFLVKQQQPYIISARDYVPDKDVSFAIQSGPRLIVAGVIPKLKPGIAERSALGITRNNQLILLVTENAPLTTTELAKMMKASPLNCNNALNLDGGSSSQLYAHIRAFRLNVHGFSNISDAVVIQ